MKRFFALVALVLGLASCQTEPEGLDVQMGGAVDATITVNIPDSETRAGGTNSAGSIFDNGILGTEEDDNTMRYILMIYDAEGQASKDRQVTYSDGKIVNFDVRLVPDRHYSFVVWADYVTSKNDTDNHYNTADLTNITLNDTWVAMDETRDAFTGVFNTKVDGNKTEYNGAKDIDITLTRPFAKLRVITTDIKELDDLHITPGYATVEYTTPYRPAFNALAGTAVAAGTDKKAHSTVFPIAPYTNEANDTHNRTIFTDYFFANEGDAVSFILNVYEDAAGQTLIKSNNFSTDIAVNRNYLTTISGNILTDGNKVNVTIEDAFENVDNNGNTTNPDYDYETISSVAEFYAAVDKLENGEGNEYNYIVVSDLNIDTTPIASLAATRSTTNKKVTINLNGKTITVNNKGTEPFITLGDDQTLVLAGAGNIIMTEESTASFVDNNNTDGGVIIEEATVTNNSTNANAKVVEGKVVVTGDADIEEDAVEGAIVSGIDALVNICANGGEFTFTEDLTRDEVILVSTTNPVVINGNGKTLNTSANRAIRVTPSNADLTINGLNIVSSAVMIYPSDVRGVSIDPDISNVQLTLNDCTIDFTDETTNDWTYAVNVADNSTGHKVTVNGGTYEGANVINVRGAKNTIVVKNATLNSLYPATANYIASNYYGACIYVSQHAESSVYAEGNTFFGDNAMALNIGNTPCKEENNYHNTKFYYKGKSNVSSADALQRALNNNDTDIKLYYDIVGDVTVIQKPNVQITIDGDNHKFNGYFKVHSNSEHYADAAVTFKNINFETAKVLYNEKNEPYFNFIEALDNGNGERYSTNITAENCTFTATGEAKDKAVGLQIKSSKWAKAINCTATDLHSLVQAQSCDTTVDVIDCTIYGKNGVAFKQVKAAKVEGTTIVAREYGIRFDGNTDNYGIVVKNNNITAAQPFIVRKMTGANNTITLEGENTLTSTREAYQIVITNGSDDVAYVIPTGTYTITGADKFCVFPMVAIVTTAAELSNAFAKGATLIELGADITLTDAWTPVGNAENPWYGVFDGKNHKISGLSVEGVDYAAFISHTAENTTVKNLTLENVNLNSTKHAAGVVCVAGAGLSLENIKVSGTIVAASYAGGIMHNGANATIKNCENNAAITANRAGGIASWVTVGANIENVVNKGNITGGVGASGIAHGFAGSIKNAKNYGTIISNNVEAAAGIAGVQKGASTYEYCYNYGNVTSTYNDVNASAAGILGQNPGSASTLKYCANFGDITAENSYASGIAYSLYGQINAQYCYNNGTVNGANGAGGIAAMAAFGTEDKASYCLNAGVITSEGSVLQGANKNVSSYYYNNGELLNVADNSVVAVEDALAVLNGDADFFKVENGVITVK